ncbi:hypothetical protein D3C77_294560 [compost metagenome]
MREKTGMLKLKRGDIGLIVLLFAVGFIWLGARHVLEQNRTYNPHELSAVITVDGELYRTIPLSGEEEEIEIKTALGHNILRKYNDGIQMVYADCPKKISMAMGFVSRPNETIVCVPNRIFVEIINDGTTELDEEEVDAYVR